MNRKEFIQKCGISCLGFAAIGMILPGCSGSKMISAQIVNDELVVPLTDFVVEKKGVKSFRKYLVLQNDRLRFPVCVYRFSATEFTALLMRCTHQGVELTAYGDKLVCSAHGSEFDNKGIVQNSPAEQPLQSFPVTLNETTLKISLKAA